MENRGPAAMVRYFYLPSRVCTLGAVVIRPWRSVARRLLLAAGVGCLVALYRVQEAVGA